MANQRIHRKRKKSNEKLLGNLNWTTYFSQHGYKENHMNQTTFPQHEDKENVMNSTKHKIPSNQYNSSRQ